MGYGIKTTFSDRYSLLRNFAKENRREMTLAEQVLWEYLRKLQGFHFRRQHPIGDYIADFICLKKKLIIEIDGGYHNAVEQQESDAVRTANLKHLGYSVLRFDNDAILHDTQTIINAITKRLLTM